MSLNSMWMMFDEICLRIPIKVIRTLLVDNFFLCWGDSTRLCRSFRFALYVKGFFT
jgi:hypothetical protein